MIITSFKIEHLAELEKLTTVREILSNSNEKYALLFLCILNQPGRLQNCYIMYGIRGISRVNLYVRDECRSENESSWIELFNLLSQEFQIKYYPLKETNCTLKTKH